MKRNFLYLLVLTTLALLALLVFSPDEGTSKKLTVNTLFLSSIADQVNDVNRVEIISAGRQEVATLLKTVDGWQFEQMGGYRADWPKIQKLLAALATAKVIETKTDKPEYYARLGVEDIAGKDAGSVLVKLSVDAQTTGILIGKRAQGRQGQYVRLQNEAASVLVDRELDVSITPLDWAESGIVDINASEVAEVEVIHPTGEDLLVTRVSADQTDFDLVDLPPDREIKSSWAVNSLASVLSMLNMESVLPGDALDWKSAVKIRLLMFSGVEIMADTVEVGDQYLLRIQASYPAANVLKSEAEDSNISIEQQEIDKRAADDVAKTVMDINQKTHGWAFVIAKHKYDAMVKKPEDLLKPLEST
jgi:hypothetical protein